jgi:PAS domain S-box-containing protein
MSQPPDQRRSSNRASDQQSTRWGRAFAVSILTLIGLVLTLGWGVERLANDISQFHGPLETARADALRLDESLTASARLFAATGDNRWREAYDADALELDAALARAGILATALLGSNRVQETVEANALLMETEREAFALATSGDQAGALSLLESAAYVGQKAHYAGSMQSLWNALSRSSTARQQRITRTLGLLTALSIVVALIALGCWRRHAGASSGAAAIPGTHRTVNVPLWRHFQAPLGIAAAGVLLAGLAAQLARNDIEQQSRIRFDRLTERLVSEAGRRVEQVRFGLHGARGMLAAHPTTNAAGFAAYVASRDLAREFPGALGFGVIERVERENLASFVDRVRSEQGSSFAVHPEGVTRDLYVVRQIEPRPLNLAAWGFDVGSERVRREAIERAIDTGLPTITGRICLLQDPLTRTGFLYYVPVYQPGTTPITPAERREALLCVLYAPVVLELAIAETEKIASNHLDFKIFDGETPTAANKIFDLDGHLADAFASGEVLSEKSFAGRTFFALTPHNIGGRRWTLATSTTAEFDASVDRSGPTIIFCAGSGASLLLSLFVWSIGTSRLRAQRIADTMTADLKQLALVAERTTNAVVVTDALGRITWVNEGFTRLTGYTLEEVLGQKPGALLQCEHTDPVTVEKMRRAIAAGEGCRVELVNRGKHGNEYSLDLSIQPIRNESDVLSGFIAIESDVTEHVTHRDSLRDARDAAEAALREARALRSTIDEHAIVSVADASGKIIDANPAFCAISGYTLPELIGQDHRIVNSGHHPKTFWVEMWRTIASGRPWRGEVCNRAKDGSLYWVDSMIAPFRDATGKIVKYVSIRSDITARKKAESQIAKTTQMLRRTGSMARVGGWELDVSTMRPIWSEEVYAIHEVDPGTPVELAAAVRYYPKDAEARVHEAIQNAIHSQAGFDLVLPFITAKGNHLWVRAQGEPVIEKGKVTRLVGAFQDVTQEVTQKHRAEEQAERVALTVRAGGLGTWDWDCVSGEVVFNEIWATMLGYQPGEIEGHVRSWERLVHPDDMPVVMRALTDHMEQKTSEYRCEHRLRRRDGSWAWVLDVGMVTKRDEDGRPLRAAGVHMDITKAKELERTLSDAKQAAEAATKSKSEFLANMSHEIRTPLTAILGYADLLREEGDLNLAPQRRLETIDTIRSAGQHLLTVINDILDLSKIEAGKMTVETVDTPLVTILHEVQSLIGPRSHGKGVALTTRFDTPIPDRIESDPTRLRQILMNLVGNASKFTEAGSITVAVRVEGERLIIDIDDTGPGMTQEQAANLFAAFSQADTTVTRKHGGTGLGLTICRRLGDLLGGKVSLFRTAPGEGSCFRLELPITPVPGATLVSGFDAVTCDRSTPTSAATRLHGRILLAEDGVDNQRLIAFHLRKAGATVEIAENGRRALDMLSAPDAAFDLLLTDMQMPEMDGYSLARTLRARGSQMPIVALTAHAMAEDRRKCTEAGCDDYASKPIDKALLLATCAKWLNSSGARAAAA